MAQPAPLLIGQAVTDPPAAPGQGHVVLQPGLANRHGLVAGATGTGKTVTLMVLAALLYAGLAERAVPRWAAIGAMLFAVSDAVLAYRKFVAQPWWGQPLTLATYYSAIGLIAWAH